MPTPLPLFTGPHGMPAGSSHILHRRETLSPEQFEAYGMGNYGLDNIFLLSYGWHVSLNS